MTERADLSDAVVVEVPESPAELNGALFAAADTLIGSLAVSDATIDSSFRFDLGPDQGAQIRYGRLSGRLSLVMTLDRRDRVFPGGWRPTAYLVVSRLHAIEQDDADSQMAPEVIQSLALRDEGHDNEERYFSSSDGSSATTRRLAAICLKLCQQPEKAEVVQTVVPDIRADRRANEWRGLEQI